MKLQKYYVRVIIKPYEYLNAIEREYSGYRFNLHEEAENELKSAMQNPYVISAWIETEVC